jgi:hypothetical protein
MGTYRLCIVEEELHEKEVQNMGKTLSKSHESLAFMINLGVD